MIIRIVFYGLLGWNIEVLWTGFNSLLSGDFNMIGHTSLWMFLIYGIAGGCFELVHKKIKDKSRYTRGVIWMYLIFGVEFISGAVLSLFGIYPWRYTGLFNIAGFIRLDYAPLWFVVGLLFEKAHIFAIKIGSLKPVLISDMQP